MESEQKKETKKLYDVAVVGGGINGAGIALDAALRGLNVILIEKDDFGSHTTSASTKLIHGGLRYLEYFEFSLVRESLRERERLLKNAPHLAWPLKLNVPIYKHSPRGPLMIKAGMIFYDLLSFDKSLPNHSFTLKNNNGRLKKIEPSIKQDGLKAIASYYDCQVGFPERLCLEIILSAEKSGASVFNYHELKNVNTNNNGYSELIVLDKVNNKTKQINARYVVNAGGIFVDEICSLTDKNIPKKMSGTKGSHIIIKKFENGPKDALYIESIQDGRPFFIVPWREYYLVGTTDIYYDGDLNKIKATKDEVDYLLYELNNLIPDRSFSQNDVLYTYSGVRPLPFEPGKKERQVTRKHIVYDHTTHEGPQNFISIIGGKLTTYRSLAEDCVDLICGKMGINKKCTTQNFPLIGGYGFHSDESYVSELVSKYQQIYSVPEKNIRYLIEQYGAKAKDVLDLTVDSPALKEPICIDHFAIKAQVVYAVKCEFAKNLSDILIRRMDVGLDENLGLDCLNAVAEIAAKYFKWNEEQIEEQLEKYNVYIKESFIINEVT